MNDRAAWVSRAIVALVLAAASGCGGLNIPAGKLACGIHGECPSGYMCADSDRCVPTGHGDGGLDAGSSADVPAADAPVDAPASETSPPADASQGVACQPGVACTPTNACHTGKTVCAAAGASCMDTAEVQADGTACGVSLYCSQGACLACADGTSCALAGQPCKLGRVSCASGLAVCVEAGNADEGKACGTSMTCASGSCVTCQADAACVPANPCHLGKLTCGTAPTCTDQGTLVADGTACGTDMVCGQGQCSACKAGQACAPAGNACHTGATTCNTGKALCIDMGQAPNGTVCGTNQICQAGLCGGDCLMSAACTPANRCHVGAISCSTGTSICADTTTSLANGTACGSDMICSAGTCVACSANNACAPVGTTCKAGTTSCATGVSVCVQTGNAADGSSCGTGVVCKTGACVPCAAGSVCTPPAAPCHVGSLSCAGGAPSCTDTTTALANGTACGNNLYCLNGTCTSCTPGVACSPGGDLCKVGTISCSTGATVCVATGNAIDGAACGTGLVCKSGSCAPICLQGATQCMGNGVQTCGADHQWGPLAACGMHQSCTGPVGTGKCTCNADTCSTAGKACSSASLIATCAQDAQGCYYQASTATCTNGACSGGSGAAACCTNACTNGASVCLSATSVQACTVGSNGCTSQVTSSCTSGSICTRNAPSACANPAWALWPMPNCPADVALGAPNAASYVDNQNGTVTDSITGLMWQQTAVSGTRDWATAVAFCPTLNLGGQTDWRLPSAIELASLLDLGRTPPLINPTSFPSTASTSFWSATPSSAVAGDAFYVGFNTGMTNHAAATTALGVRCVR
jgi:hypothetical protein